MQAPSTTEIVTLDRLLILLNISPNSMLICIAKSLELLFLVAMLCIHFRSAPAQKTLPFPRKITPLIDGLFSTKFKD